MTPLLTALINIQIFVAQSRIGDGTDKKAGNSVADVMGDLGWLENILAILGGALFIWMLVKFVMSRAKGGAGGGSMIGQIAMGLFGLMVLFNPGFLYAIADGIMLIARSVFDLFGSRL